MSERPTVTNLNVAPLVRDLLNAETIVLSTHKQCDGDGLGAMLGLYHGLKKLNKKVRVLAVDAIPKKYSFLQPERFLEVFEAPHKKLEATDLALIFDTNDRRLVEPLYAELEQKVKQIRFVDHHPVLNIGPEPTTGSYIDTRAASTGEISFALLKGLGIHLDENIAKALYTSICFDTQLFRFVKNSPSSHLIAAELLMFLKNPEEIHRHLFATHSIEKVAFLSKILGEIEFFGNGQVAVVKIKVQDLLDHQLDMDDSRDVIDMIMNVHSLQAAALFREEVAHEYKISLRSKGLIEVLGIAESYGGGGHLFAAGALLKGSYNDLKNQVVKLLLARLDDPKGAYASKSSS